MKRTYDSLYLCVLDEEQHKQTCGYWYTVDNHAIAHTAFRTEAGLVRWLNERSLRLSEPLTPAGTHSHQPIIGVYAEEMHMDTGEFYGLDPVIISRTLSNGDYTLAVITEDDGVQTVHTLNPNVKDRPVFDYLTSNKVMS